MVKKNKSAEKRVVKAEAAHKRNVMNRKTLNIATRKFLAVLKAGDKAAAATAFNEFSSVADKTAKKGAISKNSASRRKSRAAAKVAAIKAKEG